MKKLLLFFALSDIILILLHISLVNGGRDHKNGEKFDSSKSEKSVKESKLPLKKLLDKSKFFSSNNENHKKGEKIDSSKSKKSVKERKSLLQKLLDKSKFLSSNTTDDEKPLDIIMNELREKNPEYDTTKQTMKTSDIETMFNEIMEARHHDASVFPRSGKYRKMYSIKDWMDHKNIDKWDGDDVWDWQITFKEKVGENGNLLGRRDAIVEMIAVIMQANKAATGYVPRRVQVIALLVLIFHPKEKGRIIQVATGEGKSTICAMLAVYLALNGQTVDIITSSIILAIRDAQDLKEFFAMFELTVSDTVTPYESEENPKERGRRRKRTKIERVQILRKYLDGSKRKEGVKPCYTSNIVYSDISQFVFDLIAFDSNERGSRNFENVIIDEVDSIMIDSMTSPMIKSGTLYGMGFITMLQIAGWLELQWYKENNKTKTSDELVLYMKTYFTDLVTKEKFHDRDGKKDIPLPIPAHLKKLAKIRTESWAKMAIEADSMKKGKEYVVTEENNEKKIQKKIVPVDFKNTGLVQKGRIWNQGLHQFLLIKEKLRVNPEDIHACYMHVQTYIKKYIKEAYKVKHVGIYGMTGTIGSKTAQEFMAGMYPLDFVIVPSFKDKIFVEEPVQVKENREDWLKAVIAAVEEKVNRPDKKNRAVLLINLTINDTDEMVKILKEKSVKVRKFSRNDFEEYDNVKEELTPGEVVIATNLAGRGTNVIPSDNTEQNGGLHVIISFLPENLRVEGQNFGRTSRQGRKGSAQIILSKEELIKKFDKQKIDKILIDHEKDKAKVMNELRSIRDEREKAELLYSKNVQEPLIDFKAEMFKKISQFMDKVIPEPPLSILATVNKKQSHSILAQRNKTPDQTITYLYLKDLWGLKLVEIEDKAGTGIGKIDVSNKTAVDNFIKILRKDFNDFLSEVKIKQEKLSNENLHDFKDYESAKYIIDQTRVTDRNAVKNLKSAVQFDPRLGYAAHYFYAKSYIFYFDEDNGLNALNDNMKGSIASLTEAKRILEANVFPIIDYLERKLTTNPETLLQQQIQDKKTIFKFMAQNIDENLKTFNDNLKKNIVSITEPSFEIKNVFKTPQQKERAADEIQEFQLTGIEQFYRLIINA